VHKKRIPEDLAKFAAMALLVITSVFLLLYSVLIFYYYYHWRRLPVYRPAAIDTSPFISVIVAARNEEATIGHLLHALEAQSYSRQYFEAIIVDDYSTDATAAVVQSYRLPNLQLIQPQVARELSSKKKAIEAGIKMAKGELIVATDADCIPHLDWLQTIAQFYTEKGAAFIAAPVHFTYDNSLLQIFQAIDFITLQGITAASVSAGVSSMCNGANLAYTKTAFEAVNGFEGIDGVATGDDMLLMHKIWKAAPQKVCYLKSGEAIVSTAPMPTWRAFLMQRRRWASKTLVYDDYRIIAVLGFVYALNLLFPVLLVAGAFHPFYWLVAAGYWILKTIIEIPFVYSVTRFYGDEKLLRYFFFLQPLHILYTVGVGALSQLGQYEWKGRWTR
jgi:cellulose synthase/poly-beta-1,6-N-acetylglucosamine synthase-like glycosyltransferase